MSDAQARTSGDHAYIAELEAEIERLRAALATRDQPLFEGWMDEQLGLWVTENAARARRVVVYAAPAGSATPDEENDDE
jgi:hypothetical protein